MTRMRMYLLHNDAYLLEMFSVGIIMWILWNKKVKLEEIYGIDLPPLKLSSEIAEHNLRPSLQFDVCDDVKNIIKR